MAGCCNLAKVDLVARSFALAGMQQVVRTPAAVGSLLAVVEEQHTALAPAHHTVPVAVLEVARIAEVDRRAVEKERRIVLVAGLPEGHTVLEKRRMVVVMVRRNLAESCMELVVVRRIVLVVDLLEEGIAVAVVARKVVVGHMQAAVRMAAAQDTVLLVVVHKTW